MIWDLRFTIWLKWFALALLLAPLTPYLSPCLAQGSLTPPGAPAPTMKSLDQIEARTPISTLPFTITNGGSYYLTATLTGISGTNGVTILTNHVTIDLNGFALLGVPGSLDGINVGAGSPYTYTNLNLAHGTIASWGRYGVNASSSRNCHCEQLQFDTNGLGGLIVGFGATVSHCVSLENAGTGFEAYGGGVLESCSASGNHFDGIHVDGTRVVNCSATLNDGQGIRAFEGSMVTGSICDGNAQSGIGLGNDSVALQNDCIFNNRSGSTNEAGILQFYGPGRIEGNQISYTAGVGIRVSAGITNVVVIKNSTSGNTANAFSIPAGNDVGPWGQAATATSPWANIRN